MKFRPDASLFVVALALCSAARAGGDFKPTIHEEKLGKLEKDSVPSELRISSDARHVAQVVVNDEGSSVVVNDVTGTPNDGLATDSFHFSPDGKRFGYGAKIGARKVIVVDGKEYPAFDSSAAGMPVFSPDSGHFAYIALRGGKTCVVLDGVAGPDFESVSDTGLLFSPDGKRLAYIVKDGEHSRAVLDGELGASYHKIVGATFSSDGGHFAYIGMSLTTMSVMVDGHEVSREMSYIKDSLGFDGPHQLHVLALHGDEIVRLQIDLAVRERIAPQVPAGI